MTLQCVIMFSICLPCCPQRRSLRCTRLAFARLPLLGSPNLSLFFPSSFTGAFSLSHHFKLLLPPPHPPHTNAAAAAAATPSNLAVSFSLSFHSPPPLSPTHPLNQSFIPPHSPRPLLSCLQFLLYLSLLSVHCSFPRSPPHLTSVSPSSPLLSLPLYCSSFPSDWLCVVVFFLSFSSIPCLYHLFPLSDSLPSPSRTSPSSVYSLISCFVLTSAFQARCLFSTLGETVAEAVRGSHQPQWKAALILHATVLSTTAMPGIQSRLQDKLAARVAARTHRCKQIHTHADIYIELLYQLQSGICGLGGFRVVWCTEPKLGREDEVFPHQTKNPPPPF